MSKPFLTIITRCCRRPGMIAQNIASVKALTDWDVEQIFIPDLEHRGMFWANCQYAANTYRVDGQYVLLLDDDVILVESNIVQMLKAVPGRPGIIMIKAHRPQMKPNVLPRVWGQRKALQTVTVTNGRCFAPSAEIWKRHAKRYGIKAAGDYGFINSVSRDSNCTFYWLDVLVSKSLQLGRGRVEPKCPPNWFGAVCTQHGLEEVASGDWRLPLYRMTKLKPKKKARRAKKKIIPQAARKPVTPPAEAPAKIIRVTHLPSPPARPLSKHVILGRRIPK